MNPVNLMEFEAIAKEKLEKQAYDYIASGAEDGVTLRENRDAWERIVFHPKVLVDVSSVDTKTSLFGQEISMPVILAPTAMHTLSHPEGELATCRAAAAAKIIFTLSSISTYSIEQVAETSDGPLWFQLYFHKDREVTKDLLKRVEAAGYQAVCLTVDTPTLGRREPDIRNGLHLPPKVILRNYEPYVDLDSLPDDYRGSALAAHALTMMDPSMNWDDLAWLKSITKLPILLKGVITGEDAKRSVENGADGIIVSNHGGRQLDGVPATVEALPEIVDAVDGAFDVLIDGGIRRGTDVLKALAMGAKAVQIGRPYVWGLAADGEAGVKRVIGMVREELELAMKLAGRTSIAEIDESLVTYPW